MTCDVDHLFRAVFSICMSSLESSTLNKMLDTSSDWGKKALWIGHTRDSRPNTNFEISRNSFITGAQKVQRVGLLKILKRWKWISLERAIGVMRDRRGPCLPSQATENASARRLAVSPEVGGVTEVWGFPPTWKIFLASYFRVQSKAGYGERVPEYFARSRALREWELRARCFQACQNRFSWGWPALSRGKLELSLDLEFRKSKWPAREKCLFHDKRMAARDPELWREAGNL